MPFLLDGGLTCGCPPSDPAPNDPLEPFRNHFHIDPATGCVYIDECDRNFRYLGSARWDDGVRPIGNADTPANGTLLVIPGQSSVVNRTVTNTSGCDLGIVLGYDMFAAFDAVATLFAGQLVMTGFIDTGGGPVAHANVSCFSTRITVNTVPPIPGTTTNVRIFTPALASASPLGAIVGFIGPSPDEDGTPAVVLAPGATATFSVGFQHVTYFGAPGVIGGPDEARMDQITSALRIYGYSV